MPDYSNVDNERLSMELVQFAQEEQERRKRAPVYVPAEEIEAQLRDYHHILIFDPRIGSNIKTFRFWVSRVTAKQRNEGWKWLGHRHTVEAVIYYKEGEGYSVVDGIRYDWKPGDIVCVPMFAWHRHVVEKGDHMTHIAATTGPLSMYLGVAIYEDERFPQYWIHAQKGEEDRKTLIPGQVPEGASTMTDQAGVLSKGSRNQTDHVYLNSIRYAAREELDRRASRVLIRNEDLVFEPTKMGSVALAVDPATGFLQRTLGTLIAEIPAGKRSGAHRHVYEETNYVIAGTGYSIVDDQKYEWKSGDSFNIPLFSWHQHFNTGKERARFLVHHNRPYMQNMGFMITEHGEDADF